MKKWFLKVLFLLGVFIGMTHSPMVEASVNYDLWAKVLKNYVNDQGLVNYEGLKTNRKEFDQFINQLENIDAETLTPIEQKTFWINAYNALTIKVILDKYPVKSIRHINFGLVWEVRRKVAQGKKSLGHIEHKILRPMGDPRIHFAINCASIGCPKLPTEPFYPDQLDEQLDRETKRFINDIEKVKLDRSANVLYYSAILDWFEKDFLVVEPSILRYIMRYLNTEDLQYIESNKVKVKTSKYDWNLNKQ